MGFIWFLGDFIITREELTKFQIEIIEDYIEEKILNEPMLYQQNKEKRRKKERRE